MGSSISARRLAAALLFAVMAGAVSPAAAQERYPDAYLTIIYDWHLPLPNCETSQPSSCYAPFHILGKKIVGLQEIKPSGDGEELILAPLVEDPRGPLQVIDYAYTCGACKVNGQLVVHSVSGRVVGSGHDERLRFNVRFSEPFCQTDCPGTAMDIDCSYSEPVTDQFVLPLKDGAITDRPANAKLKYALQLQ